MKKYLSILLTFVFMISMVFPCTAFAAENDDMSKEQVVELAKKVFPEYAEKLENGHTTNRDRSRPVSGEVFAVVKETRAIDDLSTMTYTEHSNGTITLGIARFVKKASYSDVSSETHSAYEQFTATITAYALEGPTFIAKNVVYRIYGSDYDRITSVGNYSTPNYYSHHYNVSVNRTESASTPAYVSYQFISLIGAEERNFDVYFTVQNNVASVDIDIW